MKVKTRLLRLEKKLAKRARPAACHKPPETEEDWLERFGQAGVQGFFARESNFPAALASYRDALRQAKEQADPPFDP